MAGGCEKIMIGGHQQTPQEIAKNKTSYVEEELKKAKPVIALEYENGILLVSENPRHAVLGKIFEVYDRIACAAAGRYDEYKQLKSELISYSILAGLRFDRRDVKAKDLADRLCDVISQIFNAPFMNPLRVDLLILEVGEKSEDNLFLRIQHTGAITLLNGLAVIGGAAKEIKDVLTDRRFNYNPNVSLSQALKIAKEVLEFLEEGKTIPVKSLEVGILDRNLPGDRKFKKLSPQEIEDLLKS